VSNLRIINLTTINPRKRFPKITFAPGESEFGGSTPACNVGLLNKLIPAVGYYLNEDGLTAKSHPAGKYRMSEEGVELGDLEYHSDLSLIGLKGNVPWNGDIVASLFEPLFNWFNSFETGLPCWIIENAVFREVDKNTQKLNLMLHSLQEVSFPFEKYKVHTCIEDRSRDFQGQGIFPFVLYCEQQADNYHFHTNLQGAIIDNSILFKPLHQNSVPHHCHYVPDVLDKLIQRVLSEENFFNLDNMEIHGISQGILPYKSYQTLWRKGLTKYLDSC
jgi:hypothetical protein